jgi:formylglycine-generating enzyme required for sulfatase activity/N-acetylneuraminic acid mutarotase
MKNKRWLAALGFGLLVLSRAVSAAQWQVKADIPYCVYGHGGAVIGDRLYTIGGCETRDWTKTSARLQVYDFAKDSWTDGPNVPIELGWPVVAVYADIIYVFGGMRSGAVSTDQAWAYDPAGNTWAAITPLPMKAMNGVAITVGDAIYVGLGYQRADGTAKGVVRNFLDFYRYDPLNNRYSRLADAPEGACYAAAGAYEGNIYVVHGARYEIGFHDMNDYGWADGVLKYQPGANTWTKIDALRIQPRLFFLTQCTSSAYHAEKLLVCGGQSHYQRTKVAGYFDMRHQVFFGLPSLPDPRCCGGGGVVGDYLVLAGGFWGVGETGDPARPTWLLNVGALPDPGDTITNSIGMKLAYIPPGKFMMGSPLQEENRQYDECPHAVRLTRAFRIGTTEVTQSQWEAVMGVNRSNFKGADLPVEKVSWREAVEFCEKLGRKEGKTYRLPTEAEWEYACRAGSGGPFAGAGRLDDMGWYEANSGETTHPGGTRQPNAWGLYDMHGNVSEWCRDTYSADYPQKEVADPTGPTEGTYKVIRGGSWGHFPPSCRRAARNSAPPSYQFRETGFRVVLEVSE